MKRKPASFHLFSILAALLFLASAFFSRPSEATWLRNQFEGVRPVGMGNAFIALADDKNALWYNPAGLAFIKKSRLDFNDFVLGGDSVDTFQRIQNAAFGADADSLWRPDTQMGKVGFFPGYVGPRFGISPYYHAFGFSEIDNFDRENVDIYAVSDMGVMASVGIPVHKNFAAGISIRGLARRGIDTNQNGRELAQSLGFTQAELASSLHSRLWSSAKTGYGLGVNAGVLWRLPRPQISFAATVEDMGYTSFKGANGGTPPPPVRPTYHLGMAVTFALKRGSSVNLALDFHHLLENVIVAKQSHLGLEWNKGALSLRVGASQGYPTAGFGVSTDMLGIAFATYATELGDKLWERSQRWYQIQLTLGTPVGKAPGRGSDAARSFRGVRER